MSKVNRNLIKIYRKGRRPTIAPEATAVRFWHVGEETRILTLPTLLLPGRL
jgi:hypothetical protein